MKAAVLKTIGQPLTIEDLPVPVPGAGEVLVRVLSAPVIPYAQEVFSGVRYYPLVLPLVPGCGAMGVVEKVGPDATQLQPGQLVLCDPMVRARDECIEPDSMLQGWVARGESAQTLQTYFRNGPFAEKMLMPLENAIPMAHMDAMDPVALAWFGMSLVAYGGFLAANVQPGQTVLINGATGFFGSIGVATALAMGAECVIAPGRNQERLDALVQQLGPRVRPVLLTESEDETTIRRHIAQVAAGPIDCMLDLLGQTGDAAPTRNGILALRRGGTAVLMGGVNADIPVPYSYVMHNDLVIRGQYMYPRHAPLLLAGLFRAGLFPLEAFKTRAFALDQVNQAISYAHEHSGAFQLTVLVP